MNEKGFFVEYFDLQYSFFTCRYLSKQGGYAMQENELKLQL
jgi:hypothetical protein